MAEESRQFSIWSTFDHLIVDAEESFMAKNFDRAMELWEEYARVTGAAQWQQILNHLNRIIHDFVHNRFSDSGKYFQYWLQLRSEMSKSRISAYAFQIAEKYIARAFLSAKETVSYDLATGIFCYIDGRYEKAVDNLETVINHQPDTLLARIFLSKCNYDLDMPEKGLAYLSQALFLGSDEILTEDVINPQIRNLIGRLKSFHGKGEVGLWLAPFEAWYRNMLEWKQDIPFFQVMQQKERNERILQVKYYASEKFRHFVRCLFIAEYVRQFLPKERGIIWEQEAYMDKLDSGLFARYRRKRKPIV